MSSSIGLEGVRRLYSYFQISPEGPNQTPAWTLVWPQSEVNSTKLQIELYSVQHNSTQTTVFVPEGQFQGTTV